MIERKEMSAGYLASLETKHGNHDQSTHGRRGGGSSSAPNKKERAAHARDLVKRLGITIEQEEHDSKLSSVTGYTLRAPRQLRIQLGKEGYKAGRNQGGFLTMRRGDGWTIHIDDGGEIYNDKTAITLEYDARNKTR